MSDTIEMRTEQVHALARACLSDNGCNDANADAIAASVSKAERDGAKSHGLFRIPGYVAALRSGKVNGAAAPRIETLSAGALRVDADGGFAPLALQCGIAPLARAAKTAGAAALGVVRAHHFAALWHETEALAEHGMAALACTAYMPAVAPAGARAALFGTNPISFAWPRPGKMPVVFDMATAAMAMGEVQIAARDGRKVPPGTGLDAHGKPSTDPARIADGGVLLPFGGYKGSALSLMVELLAAALLGERFSFEAFEADNHDGGPPRGGEFLLALSPQMFAGPGWAQHAEEFFAKFDALDGARLPGARRHAVRAADAPPQVNAELLEKIRGLCRRAPPA
ncbi:MAG: Ldh family oxidoreductase [Gammaproteobacteria bacterium]